MSSPATMSLEDVVTATYCALDDALKHAGVNAKNGKLIERSGPPPKVDDCEILCIAILQEVLGFESDNKYQLWLRGNPTMRKLFPRQLSRQNFADRRAILTPLLERLCGAFCELGEQGFPPFS